MTNNNPLPETGENIPVQTGKSPVKTFFSNLKIGTKLLISIGILVVLIFLSAGVSYLGSRQANTKIGRTDEIRVPAALAASRAQANLLRMQADVRGYLALGEKEYRDSYNLSAQAFEDNLTELGDYSSQLGAGDQQRLNELDSVYEDWAKLPGHLFELRDDQLDREPAYRLLVITGTLHAGQVLINIQNMIELQGEREPTSENLALLEDMAKFQGNFASMLSALRGYTTTRNRIYRAEYEVNLVDNQNAWERLIDQRSEFTSSQAELLDEIESNRDAFLLLPDQMFAILESDRWREDLYTFSSEALPLANKMQVLLNDLVISQQTLLANDLAAGRQDLARSTQLILASGVIALIVGLSSVLLSRSTIADPIRRLTGVAEQIRSGDLEAQARVESKDEIGVLAATFNSMTTKLRDTLIQVRKEKRRADNLLEVVIPIGVELTTEKDFNRLLEKMLLEAKTFCHADAGTLYLVSEDKDLQFAIFRNDSRQLALGGTTGNPVPFHPLALVDPVTGEPNEHHVATYTAIAGVPVNIADAGQVSEFDFRFSPLDDTQILGDYQPVSMLTIPLKNREEKVLGVMQLINAQDPETGEIIPFDFNLQEMMESFSSLAVAALEAYIREQKLKQEIKQLRIEIDEARRQQQVAEIVETDFFHNISTRAQELRERRQRKQAGTLDEAEEADLGDDSEP
jgi:CHASE3 domain sensor protein